MVLGTAALPDPASETAVSSAAGVWLATCPPAVPPEELPGLKTAPLLKVMSPFQGSPPLGSRCRENGPQALSPAQDLTEDLPTSVLSAVEVKASSTLQSSFLPAPLPCTGLR